MSGSLGPAGSDDVRLFEALLLVAIAATFLALILAKPGEERRVLHVASVTILLAIIQHAVEGSRWQLAPAYLFLASLCLLGTWRNIRRSSIARANRTGRRPLIVRSSIALGAAAMAISAALPFVLPVFAFPNPGGPYAIGTVTHHWTDRSRQEVFGNVPRAAREVMVQIWYPADRRTVPAPYVDDAAGLSEALGRLHNIPAFTFTHLEHVKTNASLSVPVSRARPSYPVLLFVEGITGYRQMNTSQVEALVSQGYIVVAIDQPYVAASVAFPDGRTVAGWSKDQMDPLIQQSINPSAQVPSVNGRAFPLGIIPYLSQDVSFVIDQLAALNGARTSAILRGKLDLQRVGIFGVSLGGIVVGDACRSEPRLKACIVMDAPTSSRVTLSGLRQPAMWITRDADTMRQEGWAEADIVRHQRTMRAAFDRSRSARYFVQVPGMFHADLTDVPLFSPLTSQLGITGPIGGRRAHMIVNAYSLAFFDRHLRGRPAPSLDQRASTISEF